jgi:PIN like domain
MSLRAAQARMYVDADMLGLGKILAGLRDDVTYPGGPGAVIHRRQRPPCPVTSPDVLDTDWMPEVAGRGWLIVTRDSMITQNRNEITAVSGRTRRRWWPSTSGTRRRNGGSLRFS